MREVTIKKKVLRFEELEADVQKEVLEHYRNAECSHHGWWDPIMEGILEDLIKMGFEEVNVNFELNFAQGDGASITANKMNIEKLIKHFDVTKRFGPSLVLAMGNDLKGYVKESVVSLDLDPFEGTELINAQELEIFLEKEIERLAADAYQRLRKYNLELSSDERVKAFIDEEVGEFEEDGTIYVDNHLEVAEPEELPQTSNFPPTEHM